MSEPLLAYDTGSSPRRGLLIAIGAGFVVMALAAGALIEAHATNDMTRARFALLALPILSVLIIAVTVRLEFVRRARIEVFTDRIVIDRSHASYGRRHIPFWTVAGFKDDHADRIELVPGPSCDIPAPLLVVPTPTEELRAKLLSLIVARGIPRVEA